MRCVNKQRRYSAPSGPGTLADPQLGTPWIGTGFALQAARCLFNPVLSKSLVHCGHGTTSSLPDPYDLAHSVVAVVASVSSWSIALLAPAFATAVFCGFARRPRLSLVLATLFGDAIGAARVYNAKASPSRTMFPVKDFTIIEAKHW